MELEKIEKQLDELTRSISLKHLEFAKHCLDGHSPVDAVKLSGLGTGNCNDDSALAKKLRNSPAIRLYINLIKKRVSKKSCLSLEKIDQILSNIATSDLLDMIEIGEREVPIVSNGELVASTTAPEIRIRDTEDLTESERSSIKSIKIVKGDLQIELCDKLKALDMLIRRQSGYKDVSEINHTGNVQVLAITGDNGRLNED